MPGSSSRTYIHEVLTSLYVHRYFGCVVLCFTAFVWIVSAVSDRVRPAELQLYSSAAQIGLGLTAAILLARRVMHLACVDKERRPVRRLAADFKQWVSSANQMVSLLIVLLLLPWFHSAVTYFKSMIPIVQPFCWDDRLSRIDRALHFGHLPSEWTRYCLGNTWTTFGVNFLYNVWMPLMFGFIFWQAFQNRRRMLRMQFLISYVLIWIVIGSFLAAAFSSGGPCYFGRLTSGSDIYARHMECLRTSDTELCKHGSFFGVWALGVQEMLWEGYARVHVGVGSGISAMPSMHVAVATLMALTAWPYRGWIRWTFFAYLFVIQVGSVHLAWHYAVDGYVSMIVTLLIWKAAEPFSRRATRPQNAESHQTLVSPSTSRIAREIAS